MAIFTETRTPYEFLVRWDKEGTIQGSHVGWLDTVKKDSEILTQTPSNVEAVGVDGFPLNDILSQLQIDSLKEIEIQKQIVIELKAEIEIQKQIVIELKAEIEIQKQIVIELKAEIEVLKQGVKTV